MQAVYLHLDNNGEIFYVGAGSIENRRPWGTNSRSQEWYDHCKGEFHVRIVKEFDNRKEAFDYEAELTQKLIDEGCRPLVNKIIGTHAIGEKNGMYGKGYLLKGREKSKEHREKLRQSNIGKQAGEKNPMFGNGILVSGIKSGSAKQIQCIETGEVYLTLGECSEKTGISRHYIRKSMNGEEIPFLRSFKHISKEEYLKFTNSNH